MRGYATLRDLPLCGLDIAKERELVQEFLVDAHVQQDGGAATVLRENHRTASRLHLVNHGGGVRAELSDWANAQRGMPAGNTRLLIGTL